MKHRIYSLFFMSITCSLFLICHGAEKNTFDELIPNELCLSIIRESVLIAAQQAFETKNCTDLKKAITWNTVSKNFKEIWAIACDSPQVMIALEKAFNCSPFLISGNLKYNKIHYDFLNQANTLLNPIFADKTNKNDIKDSTFTIESFFGNKISSIELTAGLYTYTTIQKKAIRINLLTELLACKPKDFEKITTAYIYTPRLFSLMIHAPLFWLSPKEAEKDHLKYLITHVFNSAPRFFWSYAYLYFPIQLELVPLLIEKVIQGYELHNKWPKNDGKYIDLFTHIEHKHFLNMMAEKTVDDYVNFYPFAYQIFITMYLMNPFEALQYLIRKGKDITKQDDKNNTFFEAALEVTFSDIFTKRSRSMGTRYTRVARYRMFLETVKTLESKYSPDEWQQIISTPIFKIFNNDTLKKRVLADIIDTKSIDEIIAWYQQHDPEFTFTIPTNNE